jgi:hypothetical protein
VRAREARGWPWSVVSSAPGTSPDPADAPSTSSSVAPSVARGGRVGITPWYTGVLPLNMASKTSSGMS